MEALRADVSRDLLSRLPDKGVRLEVVELVPRVPEVDLRHRGRRIQTLALLRPAHCAVERVQVPVAADPAVLRLEVETVPHSIARRLPPALARCCPRVVFRSGRAQRSVGG